MPVGPSSSPLRLTASQRRKNDPHGGNHMTTRSAFLTVTVAAMLLAQSKTSYHVTHTYTLGGDGSWDYVVPDPPNHRLFIARQTRVMVVDEDSGTLLGEISG